MTNIPEPRFGFPVAPFHRWFAWHPVRLWDGRWAFLRTVYRRLIQKHDYLSGPMSDWWQYSHPDCFTDKPGVAS